MADWVDVSTDARYLRRAAREGRRDRAALPWWVFALKPPAGSSLCPDCGHAPHWPARREPLAGKMCPAGDCYCRAINGVTGAPMAEVRRG